MHKKFLACACFSQITFWVAKQLGLSYDPNKLNIFGEITLLRGQCSALLNLGPSFCTLYCKILGFKGDLAAAHKMFCTPQCL